MLGIAHGLDSEIRPMHQGYCWGALESPPCENSLGVLQPSFQLFCKEKQLSLPHNLQPNKILASIIYI